MQHRERNNTSREQGTGRTADLTGEEKAENKVPTTGGDISDIDRQEGSMQHGTKGGNLDEPQPEKHGNDGPNKK